MTNSIGQAQAVGQSIWLDFISRGMINSGQLKSMVDNGLRGMTSNPTIFHKAITTGAEYDGCIQDVLRAAPGISTEELYDRLIVQDIQAAADVLRPVYESSGGIDGLVSLEPPAQLAYDTEATISEVKRLWRLVDRPNVMMKVPATPEGVPAVEELLAQGININITLMFSMTDYEAVSRAYLRGAARCGNTGNLVSVASFFVSRVDTYVDKELEKIATGAALALRGKAAVANCKVVYRRFREVFGGKEFEALRERGARVQRLLWGSTSTKNPAYPDVKYVEELIGPDTINTLPVETLQAFLDHGKVGRTIDKGVMEAEHVLAGLKDVGVNLDGVTEQLQKDGVKAFVDSLDQLLRALDEKRKVLVG